MTAYLPEIEVNILEHHTIYSPDAEPRSFEIKTTISGSKSEIAALYDRADAILDAVTQSLPTTMADCEVVTLETTYVTPQLDQLHELRMERRPKLPSRYL